MGGATERPTADYVYDHVSQALAQDASPADAELDLKPKLDSRGIPWPLFLSILAANGWFLTLRPFPHQPNGPSIQRRFIGAMLRIPVFIAAWVLAWVTLPKLLVGIAFLAWAAWITPHVRYISDQFQNVKTP